MGSRRMDRPGNLMRKREMFWMFKRVKERFNHNIIQNDSGAGQCLNVQGNRTKQMAQNASEKHLLGQILERLRFHWQIVQAAVNTLRAPPVRYTLQ
jgi:hypothetical protein